METGWRGEGGSAGLGDLSVEGGVGPPEAEPEFGGPVVVVGYTAPCQSDVTEG